jgi:hypothetical protein
MSDGNTVYLTGSDKDYIIVKKDSGWHWHEAGEQYPMTAHSNGVMYAATSNRVVTLLTGDRGQATLKSKEFTTGLTAEAMWVWVDVLGPGVQEIFVNGNRTADWKAKYVAGDSSKRRRIRTSVKGTHNEYFDIEVRTNGETTVYGYGIEVMDNAPSERAGRR